MADVGGEPGALIDILTEGPAHTVELDETGFVLRRRSTADPDAFNGLVREPIENAGSDYVALPSPAGAGGYDQLIVVLY